MKYVTNKGTFSTLVELQYAYLESGENMRLDPGHAEANEWDKTVLHASEVGGCPRQQMLRLSGAEEKPRANLTKACEATLFWVANRLHFLVYEAMDWAGILWGHEVPLFDAPWAGRADAIFRPDINSDELVLYDRKTVRPNAMKYTESFPKEAHCLQLGVYAVKLPHITKGMVEYVDRGGSNPPVECVVDLEPWKEAALGRMLSLEAYRKALLEDESLPEALPESMVAHFRKVRMQSRKNLSSITLDCDWRCSFCPYCHTVPPRNARDNYPPLRMDSPCSPPWHEPMELAKLEKGSWKYTPEGKVRAAEVERFLAEQPSTVDVIGGQDE